MHTKDDWMKMQAEGMQNMTPQDPKDWVTLRWHIGDVVKLKSGGVQMVVSSDIDYSTRKVLCYWSDEGRIREELIHQDCLKRVGFWGRLIG